MASPDEKLVDHLNHLVTICNDGKYGYETAFNEAKSPELKRLFSGSSLERKEFATALKYEVRKAGGDPDHGGGPVGALHRAWISVKNAVSSNEDKVLLADCIAGEKAAINAYEQVLKDALLATDVRTVISIQLFRIKEALNNLKQLSEKL